MSIEVDELIATLQGWQSLKLSAVRTLIVGSDPAIVETVKWKKPSNPAGVPVWECEGILCTGETYKDKVKLTFPKGAQLPDPKGLFNASLEGNARRAIDLFEGSQLDTAAFQELVRAAITLNRAGKAK